MQMAEMRVKFADETEIRVNVADAETTMRDVLAQVRQAKGWDEQHHARFICGGQELYLEDRVSRAAGNVVHCITSRAPSHRFASHKHGSYKSGDASAAVDWLEVVDPGTVLMWIFGSILALLWLLFVFYAHMFDRTSVVMLCMMTVAFLIPCALSYIPCLRLLNGPRSGSSSASRQQVVYYSQGGGTAAAAGSGGREQHHQQQQQYLRGSGTGGPASAAAAAAGWGSSAYGTQIPPRPAARVRPGAAAPH